MPKPLKNITLRQLATFHALSRLGSVSRTAREMNLSQPAVSLQLGALEESADTPLVARSARGVRLTVAGELLADYAERILALWGEAGDALAAQKGHVAGSLRIGAATTAEYLLPQLLLEFVKRHPQVNVTLQVGNRAEIIGQLAAQEVDLAIMGRPPSELKVDAAPFARHPMAFVTSPTHPLMSLAAPSLQDLNDANLLVRERGSGTRTAVEQLYKSAGVEMRLGSEMSSNEAIKQMCAAGFGVAFISLHACVTELKSGLLSQVPMANHPILRDWYVIALEGRPVPAAAAAFSAFLQEQGQALVDEGLATQGAPMPSAASPARKAKVKVRTLSSDAADASAFPTD